jgi:hypothetical protein
MIVRNEKKSISWAHERVEIGMIMLSEIIPVSGDLKHLTRVQLLDIRMRSVEDRAVLVRRTGRSIPFPLPLYPSPCFFVKGLKVVLSEPYYIHY